MLREIHHVGYSVSNVEETIAEYQRLFGAKVISRRMRSDGSPMAFIAVGNVQLELLQNATEPGQHFDHIAYVSDDVDADLADLKRKGASLASQEPVVGSDGARFVFVNLLGSRIQVYKPA